MLAAGYGKIINTASMSASIVNTPQNQVVYNTTKGRRAAFDALAGRRMGATWHPRQQHQPGYTRTQLVEDLLQTPVGQEIAPKWLALTPWAVCVKCPPCRRHRLPGIIGVRLYDRQ